LKFQSLCGNLGIQRAPYPFRKGFLATFGSLGEGSCFVFRKAHGYDLAFGFTLWESWPTDLSMFLVLVLILIQSF